MNRALSPVSALTVCGAVLVALMLAGVSLHVPGNLGIGSNERLDWFVLLACVSGAIYGGTVVLTLRREFPPATLWLILGGALVMRLVVLFAPPFLSTDLYRYVWDGKVQLAGINPYRYIPDAPELSFLRDSAIFPNINRADFAPTIYPPAAQMIFLLVARISASVIGMKLAMVAFEALAVAVVIRLLDRAGLPRQRVLIYAWNPLAVWEFAGNGHIDAASVGLIAVALLAATRGRPVLTGLVLGAATLVKFLPVVLFPALWRRRDLGMPAAFAAVIAAGYAVYADVGWRVFGFLLGYFSEEGLRTGGGIYYLKLLGHWIEALPIPVYIVIVAAIFATLSWRMIFGTAVEPERRDDPIPIARNALILATAVMVAITPHYPWYFAWLALPACLVCSYSVLYLTVASFLLYLDPRHLSLLWPGLVYFPFALLVATELWRHRADSPDPMPRALRRLSP